MNFDVVDQSEVQIKINDGSCDIISYTSTMISCIPPQSGVGTANVVVSCYIAPYALFKESIKLKLIIKPGNIYSVIVYKIEELT